MIPQTFELWIIKVLEMPVKKGFRGNIQEALQQISNLCRGMSPPVSPQMVQRRRIYENL